MTNVLLVILRVLLEFPAFLWILRSTVLDTGQARHPISTKWLVEQPIVGLASVTLLQVQLLKAAIFLLFFLTLLFPLIISQHVFKNIGECCVVWFRLIVQIDKLPEVFFQHLAWKYIDCLFNHVSHRPMSPHFFHGDRPVS